MHCPITGGWPDIFGQAVFNSAPQKEVTVVSLFSGAGGLDIGFHDAGFKILECNELVPLFSETLSLNSRSGERFYGTKIQCMDIKDYIPQVKHADFVIGGPPCQTFSAAGARAAGVMGTDDERGNLFLEYARILKLLDPKGFLFENVYRIVGAQSGKPWAQIQNAFKKLGYKLFWRIVDAADYGAPQFRERLIIVGLKEGTFLFPEPTHGPDSKDNRPYYSAGHAVAGLNEKISEKDTKLTGRHGYLLENIPPGLNYSFYTERMGHPHPIFAWRSKFSDYLYKADPETPVRTIKAQGGQYTGPLSWENRYFTVREFKRLQSFPDDYKIEGSRLKVIHQLGNSVPPQLARILAISVMNQVFGGKYPFEIAYLPEGSKLGFRKRKADLTEIYEQKAHAALINLKSNAKDDTEISPVTESGENTIHVNPDFSYIVGKHEGNSSIFHFSYVLQEENWNFLITEPNSKSVAYSVCIQIPSFFRKGNKALKIRFDVESCREDSLLALWKILEYYIKSKYWKDDLVQVFGYYQNKGNYSIKLDILSHEFLDTEYWKIAQKIMTGVCIGKIVSLPEICDAWQMHIPEQTLKSAMSRLKNNGYEIRSHRTNSQIKEGQYLIPYAFATLNERSLQRLTQL